MKYFFIISIFVIFLSCGEKSQTPDMKETSFSVDILDEAGFQKLILDRNGKFLFINVWATWCIPCREEFPDLIKLANIYQSKQIEFIGLSADYPDEIELKILPFLKEFDLNFKIYVQKFKSEQDFINRLNESWSGALPASFIYNPNGVQLAFLNGKKSFSEFQEAIEKHLNNQ